MRLDQLWHSQRPEGPDSKPSAVRMGIDYDALVFGLHVFFFL